MNLRFLAPALPLCLLVGCSSQEDQAGTNGANLSAPIVGNEAGPVGNGNESTGNASAAPAGTEASGEAEDRDKIPLAMRGRWGLVAADCTSTHGDAKGLLEISGTALTFFESRGTLKGFIEWAPARIRADFDFLGEGMSWRREMALDLKDGGRTLIRTEYGEDAAPAPLSYRRCPA